MHTHTHASSLSLQRLDLAASINSNHLVTDVSGQLYTFHQSCQHRPAQHTGCYSRVSILVGLLHRQSTFIIHNLSLPFLSFFSPNCKNGRHDFIIKSNKLAILQHNSAEKSELVIFFFYRFQHVINTYYFLNHS